MRNAERVRELEIVATELRKSGDMGLAERVNRVVEDLRQETTPSDGELMTTGDAAELLGVRSINTVKRWVRDGLLSGYRRGGRILVSRSSVIEMADRPTVAEQQAFKREIDAAIHPYGVQAPSNCPCQPPGRGNAPGADVELHDAQRR